MHILRTNILLATLVAYVSLIIKLPKWLIKDRHPVIEALQYTPGFGGIYGLRSFQKVAHLFGWRDYKYYHNWADEDMVMHDHYCFAIHNRRDALQRIADSCDFADYCQETRLWDQKPLIMHGMVYNIDGKVHSRCPKLAFIQGWGVITNGVRGLAPPSDQDSIS